MVIVLDLLRLTAGVDARRVPGAAASGSGSGGGAFARTSRVAWRTQRKPKMIATAAPTPTMIQLMTRPTRRTATPMAKPIGRMLGVGWC